jgi:hypothetical protein
MKIKKKVKQTTVLSVSIFKIKINHLKLGNKINETNI